MPKTLLIVRRDNVLFKELADSEEPGLFDNFDESLNSFRENQLLFEIENNRLGEGADHSKRVEADPHTDQPKSQKSRSPSLVDSKKSPDELSKPNGKPNGLANHVPPTTDDPSTGQSPSEVKIDADEIKQPTKKIDADEKRIKRIKGESHSSSSNRPLDVARERYIRSLENDNCVLEQLLDDLQLLKSARNKTGRLNCAAEQVELVKRKLAHYVCRQRNEQLTEVIFEGGAPLFRDNEECLRFIRHILQNELDLKIDDDHQLNSDLNLYLRLKLRNELILGELLEGLNVRHDSRPAVQRYVQQFRAKLEPRQLGVLLDVQRTFGAIDRRMKAIRREHGELLRRYYEVLKEKELLQLRYFSREWQLVERFRTELKHLRSGNLSAGNKMNVTERALKRVQNKL